MNSCALLEGVTPQPGRAAVEALQRIMLTMPQVELPTSHYYADHMYLRAVFRKKGTVIVGKIHKRQHFYIVAMGKVQVGKEVYPAGTVIVSEPGTKRAVLALEDSICMTVHHTNKRNLSKIERELIEPDETALFDSENKMKALK
jgi:quercetin dioxygenase-like cupin family protein